MQLNLNCKGLIDLPALCKQIIETFPTQRIFALNGNLGAGKTTIIKELCKELQVIQEPKSPTFTIINEYYRSNGEILYHFDFYRVVKISEVLDLGLEEYFFSGSYCFIEWPSIVEQFLPKSFVEISISLEEDNNRQIICKLKSKN